MWSRALQQRRKKKRQQTEEKPCWSIVNPVLVAERRILEEMSIKYSRVFDQCFDPPAAVETQNTSMFPITPGAHKSHGAERSGSTPV